MRCGSPIARGESEVHDDEKIKAREKDETYQHT
jgi:hypothetical protein